MKKAVFSKIIQEQTDTQTDTQEDCYNPPPTLGLINKNTETIDNYQEYYMNKSCKSSNNYKTT